MKPVEKAQSVPGIEEGAVDSAGDGGARRIGDGVQHQQRRDRLLDVPLETPQNIPRRRLRQALHLGVADAQEHCLGQGAHEGAHNRQADGEDQAQHRRFAARGGYQAGRIGHVPPQVSPSRPRCTYPVPRNPPIGNPPPSASHGLWFGRGLAPKPGPPPGRHPRPGTRP